MKKYLLDTSACIAFLKGEFDMHLGVSHIGYENCFITDTSIFELYFGLVSNTSMRHKEHWDAFEEFKKLFENRTIETGQIFDVARQQNYAVNSLLDNNGNGVDVLIGYTAILSDFYLLTCNIGHYCMMHGLKVVDLSHQSLVTDFENNHMVCSNEFSDNNDYDEHGGPSDGYGGHLSDSLINDAFDGEADAYWNID